MDCNKVRSLLSPHLDGELGERAHRSLTEHLRRCPSCARVFEAYKNFGQLLKLEDQRTMKPFLWTRIAAELREGVLPQPWIAQINTPWLGWAAALLLPLLLVVSALFIGLKIIPNGRAESAPLAESTSLPTTETDFTSPGMVSDASQLSKDSVLSIILYDNGETNNR